MEFEIQIVGTDKHGNEPYHEAIKVDSCTVGIARINMIRKELDVELPISAIEMSIDEVRKNIVVVVPEDIARLSGVFTDTAVVKVTVQEGQLNRFLKDVVDTTRSCEDDAITEARIERTIDEEKVIDAWKKAGFPLKWNLQEPSEDRS